jgi:phosphatidylserine/phosphatidylglycerophosphate/cardiolipin synthase-like enzyme
MAFVLLLCVALGVVAIGQSAIQTCSVQAFFTSPGSDNHRGVIENKIISLIEGAKFTIDIAMFSFTDDQLGDAIVAAAKDPDVTVHVLLDGLHATGDGGEYERSLKGNGTLEVLVERYKGMLHHKFMVIDSKIVVTGSYNWSGNAETKHYENIVVIQCPKIAAAFTSEFNHVWSTLEAGGTP